MRSHSPALVLVAFVPLVLGGCAGYRLKDVSTDPAPGAVVATRPVGARAVIAARSSVRVLPDEPDTFFEDRMRLAAAHTAVACAKVLRSACAFEEVVLRDLAPVRRPGDVELVLTEEILAAPRFEIGPRRLAAGVLYLSLLIPIAIPIDAVYTQRLPGVEARYTLELRDDHGKTARFETVSSIEIQEQACAPQRDDEFPWLAHGPAVRLARERALQALIAKLVVDKAGGPR